MTRFFKLTSEMSDFLRENLTLSEWKLWSYLVTLDPFGDQYQALPPVPSILEKCDISKATFYRAIAKLQNLELFDFQERGIDFRNLQAEKRVSSVRQESHGCDENLMDEARSLMNENLSIYTEDQTLSEESEAIRKKLENSLGGQEVAITIGEVTEISQSSLVEAIDYEEEKFSGARTQKKVRQSAFDWLPDGPWSIDGKLDPNFRDWLAHDWLSQYGGDIHRRRADVLSHFKKDPANLPIRWEQYQSEFLNRFENAQILINNGVAIPETSQDKLMANQRAITQSLPQEMNPIATLPHATIEPLPLTQGIVQSVEPQVIALTPSQESPGFVPIPEKVDNCQAYRLFKPQTVEEPITPEQWEEAKAKLAKLSNKFNFGKGSPRKNSTPHRGVVENHQEAIAGESVARKQANCEELNRWIQDPLLRDEAVKRVKASDCYKCLFDEAGVPYQVIWCEEF